MRSTLRTLEELLGDNEKLFKALQELYRHRRQLRETLEMFRKDGMCFCTRGDNGHLEACKVATKTLEETKT